MKLEGIYPVPAPLYLYPLGSMMSVQVDPAEVRELIARPADWRQSAEPEEVGLSGAHTVIATERGPLVLSRAGHFICTRLSLPEVAALLWPSTLNLSLVERNRALIRERDLSMEKEANALARCSELWREKVAAIGDRDAANNRAAAACNERDGYRSAALKLESDLVAARAETLKEAGNCNRWARDYYAVRDERDAARASSEGHARRLVNLTAEKEELRRWRDRDLEQSIALGLARTAAEDEAKKWRGLYESLKGAAESRGCTVIVAEGMSCTISPPPTKPSLWQRSTLTGAYHYVGNMRITLCHLFALHLTSCATPLPPAGEVCKACAKRRIAAIEAEPILTIAESEELHFLQGLDPKLVPEGPLKVSRWQWRECLGNGVYHRVGQGDATVCGISLRSASKWREVGEGEAVDRAKVCDQCAEPGAEPIEKAGLAVHGPLWTERSSPPSNDRLHEQAPLSGDPVMLCGRLPLSAAWIRFDWTGDGGSPCPECVAAAKRIRAAGVQICQHQPVSLPDGSKFCAKCGKLLPEEEWCLYTFDASDGVWSRHRVAWTGDGTICGVAGKKTTPVPSLRFAGLRTCPTCFP